MSQTLGAITPVSELDQSMAARDAVAQPRAEPSFKERARFIPVSRNALIQALSAPEHWPGFAAGDVKTCFNFMAEWRHLTYASREQDLIESYLPFNPDRDISDTALTADAQDGRHKQAFIAALRQMLERANFDEIPRGQLQDIIDEFDPYGLELDVDLSEFDDILVFVRGADKVDVKPDFISRVRGRKPITVAVFVRVFLMFTLKHIEDRIKAVMIAERVSETKARKIVAKQRKMMPADVDDTHIYIKMFKDVPRPDLEIMFPNTRVLLRPADKITIGASASGGIGMGVVSIVTKAVAAALSPIGAALAVLGLAGAASQQVAQVMNRRARYMLKMTRNLYFQNLSNNQGALAFLTERAEEEDIKEELLLYALLAKTNVLRSELGEAQTAIEEFLAEHFKVRVSFDTEDALERLMATGLVVEHSDGALVAMSPATACERITSLWQDYLERLGRVSAGTTVPV